MWLGTACLSLEGTQRLTLSGSSAPAVVDINTRSYEASFHSTALFFLFSVQIGDVKIICSGDII